MSDSEKRGIRVRADVYGRPDGILRYEAAYALAAEIHAFVTGRSERGHECHCPDRVG